MLNRAILIGRLTKDPELKYTSAGIAVAQFTLALDRPFTKEGGEKETDFIPIVTWRQLAENCANYLRKGRLAAVEGRMQVRNYENNEGRRVYVTEVIADNVRFLESVNREGSQEGRDGLGGTEGNNNTDSRSKGSNAGGGDPFADDRRPIDISDDDLPF